ncbi:hypothetical protein [Pedococcus dokdonensis]|uniref:hypothetical protein n=1 Tax=Pedococcus dokdonensis TaxID=443156 RepID=UPI000B87545A|nr:hypothetical protein [Pedococcus dokdonensis]
MAKYDPDRTTSKDFDASDLEMVEGYLNHQNTVAMHEELAGQAQHLPREDQVAELSRAIIRDRDLLDDLQDRLRSEDPPRSDPRWDLAEVVRHSIDASVERLNRLRSRQDGET